MLGSLSAFNKEVMSMDSFKINGIKELLDILRSTEEKVIDAISDRKTAYKKYTVRKGNGERTIHSLSNDHPIYLLQKNLYQYYFNSLLFPECVYGFRKGKSYYDYLLPHVSTLSDRYFLRLDISNFFDSIQMTDVRQSIDYYIANEIERQERKQIIDMILDIISFDNHIIQGAITSPVISNLVFRSLDIRIEKYCKERGIKYSRYADDLLFSSKYGYIHNYKFVKAISSIISDKGFSINQDKTLKYQGELSINGYVVGDSIRLSRKKLIKLNRFIYNMSRSSFTGFTNASEKYISRNMLAGYRSFLIQSLRYIKNPQLIEKTNNKLRTIEYLIRKHCQAS